MNNNKVERPKSRNSNHRTPPGRNTEFENITQQTEHTTQGTPSLAIYPWTLQLPWSDHHYPEGDPRCICMLCGEVIGSVDDDPRRENHDPECMGCAVCEIAIRLWKGSGKDCVEQRYHDACFGRVLAPRPTLGPVEPS